MTVAKKLLAVFLAFAVCTARVAYAQDDEDVVDEDEYEDEVDDEYVDDDSEIYDEDEEEDDGKLKAHPDIATTAWFVRTPSSSSPRIPSGSVVEVLIGVANLGSTTVTVTHVSAQLVAPEDFNYTFAKYAVDELFVKVPAGEQITIAYDFQLHEDEPRDFGLKLLAFMDGEEEESHYQSDVYSDLIHIIEPVDFTDSETFFTYCAIVGGVIIALIIAYKLSTRKSKGGRRAATRETGTEKAITDADNDYIADFISASAPKNSNSKKKKSKGKK